MESSYPYSPPTLPGRETLADMIVWHANLETRREFWDPDSTLLTELVDTVIEMAASWRPTTELHFSYARAGRVLEWMVWSTVSATDETMAAAYTDEDCLEPWGIKIETLPRYGQVPASLRAPEATAENDPRVIVLPIEDLRPEPDEA